MATFKQFPDQTFRWSANESKARVTRYREPLEPQRDCYALQRERHSDLRREPRHASPSEATDWLPNPTHSPAPSDSDDTFEVKQEVEDIITEEVEDLITEAVQNETLTEEEESEQDRTIPDVSTDISALHNDVDVQLAALERWLDRKCAGLGKKAAIPLSAVGVSGASRILTLTQSDWTGRLSL